MGGWKQIGKAICFRYFVLAAILAQPLANGTGYEVAPVNSLSLYIYMER